MSKKQMRLLSAIALTLCSVTLTACGTRETPRTVSDACLTLATLTYQLMPKVERETAIAEGRTVRDDGNMADSDITRAAIGEHNARWRAVCEVKK